MPIRVAAVFEIPTPYRQPVFERLSRNPAIEIDFYFLSRTQADRHWDDASIGKLPATYLPGRQICIRGYHTFHINCGVDALFSKKPYDVVVIGGYSQPAFWKLLRHCWRKQRPYVMVTESHLKKRRNRLLKFLKNPFVRRVYRRSSANLVMGKAATEYVTYYGAQTEKIFPFPNLIDGPSYSTAVAQERQRLGAKTGPTILFVGALNRRKGVDLLLEAFISIEMKHPKAELLLVGTGVLEPTLRSMVRVMKLEDRVHFKGFIQPTDLPKIYAQGDLFVLPSLEEPYGAVLGEAMAAGLPVIASHAVGAAEDLVGHGENGLLVEPGNLSELSASLDRLLSDPEGCARMSRESERRMKVWGHERLEASFIQAIEAAI